MDLEVTHPTRYHRKRVVRPPQSLSVRVVPARRCNNVSKLLEYPLRLPYPAPYEGTSYLCIIERKIKEYVSSVYWKKYKYVVIYKHIYT